jgi:hypothetical protein
MIHNLFDLSTPGIFSSKKSIDLFHSSGQNPVVSGTVIIEAWIAGWMSASPSSEPLTHAL